MHHLYSSIISQKCISIFSIISIYCIYIKIFKNKKYFENYTLRFIKMNSEDLQHWIGVVITLEIAKG